MGSHAVVTDEWQAGEFTVRREQNRGHGVPWYRITSRGADTSNINFRLRAEHLLDLADVVDDAAEYAEEVGDV